MYYSPVRSLGVSTLDIESDLEKLRFAFDWNVPLGVIDGDTLSLIGSTALRPSEFHLRCLFVVSKFPTVSWSG